MFSESGGPGLPRVLLPEERRRGGGGGGARLRPHRVRRGRRRRGGPRRLEALRQQPGQRAAGGRDRRRPRRGRGGLRLRLRLQFRKVSCIEEKCTEMGRRGKYGIHPSQTSQPLLESIYFLFSLKDLNPS